MWGGVGVVAVGGGAGVCGRVVGCMCVGFFCLREQRKGYIFV